MKNKILLIAFSLFQVASISAQQLEFEEPEKLSAVNTNGEESFPLFDESRKTLYIARTAHKENTGGKKSGNEIILYDRTEQGEFVESTVDISNINNEYSNAIVGINKDGSRAYLLNRYVSDSVMEPGLSYTERVESNKWSSPTNLELEGIEMDDRVYNIFVNEDETLIFMSMNKGGLDSTHNIFVIEKNGAGWGLPRKLNDSINSAASNEITPFISKDGRFLYYASDRDGGQGGFDLYRSERLSSSYTEWSQPVNLEDLNSSGFDAYLSVDDENTFYFSSARGLSLTGGLADIYTSKLKEQKDTVKPVIVDVGPVTSFHPYVNFEFDVYKLNKSAKDYLTTIADSLKKNPDWNVTLNGHTDSIGTNAYNMELSRKRAKSARDYLVSSGISSNRITTRQFGESEPTTTNETALGRFINRRVEIKFEKENASTERRE